MCTAAVLSFTTCRTRAPADRGFVSCTAPDDKVRHFDSEMLQPSTCRTALTKEWMMTILDNL